MVGGTWTNSYPETQKITGPAPHRPWAMHLTDDAGQPRFLVFDFDAKAGNAQRDALRICAILNAAGIRRVVTTSGPSGGRHVWVALTGDTPHSLVSELADLAASLYRSLDITPLKNARTGAVRPPFSPHRVPGAISEPDAPTDITPLLEPSTRAEQLRNVAQHLRDMGAELPAPSKPLAMHGVIITPDGHPKLAGDRRSPSQTTVELLRTPPAADSDMSHTAARILAGLAAARYGYADIVALVETAPGLENLRTMHHPSGRRVARTERGKAQSIARKWRYAVQFVAEAPQQSYQDEDFEERAQIVLDAVLAAQDAADASTGRWRRKGYRDRLVLDALCANMLAAARTDIEMDVRRLALETGYGRNSCALALHALATDGWIIRSGEAEGIHGARFSLAEKFSTSDTREERTQVMTHPPQLPLERDLALRALQLRLERASDGLFAAPRALGRTCGRIAAALRTGVVHTIEDLRHAAGLDAGSARYGLRELHRAGLVSKLRDGWVGQLFEFTTRRLRDLFDVAEWATQRTQRTSTERYLWAWWSSEVQWHSAKRADKGRRRQDSTAIPLFDGVGVYRDFPQYPKGRRPHAQARRIVLAAGIGSTTSARAA